MISPFSQIYSSNPAVKDEFVAVIAEQFVRAGGTITMTEWAGLSDQERRVLVEARDLIESERAEALARMILQGVPMTDEEVGEEAQKAAQSLAGAAE